MCIFKIKTKTTPGAPAIAPRVDQDTALPTAKKTEDSEQIASVKYGSAKRESGSAAAQQTGTDALKINIDSNPGAGTGGVNV